MPVGGQGIASGFRDAISLAWRLAVGCNLLNTDAATVHGLLSGWYNERKQQLEKSLATTIEDGNFVTASNALKIFIRDWNLWFQQLIPSWRHYLHLGNRREGMVQYEYRPGMPFLARLGGGRCFPQVYCKSLASSTSEEVCFTDDVIWGTESTALFRFVLLVRSLSELEGALKDIEQLRNLHDGGAVDFGNFTTIVEDTEASLTCFPIKKASMQRLYRVATAAEFAKSYLCNRRPEPIGYKPYRLGTEVQQKRFLFLRPDRFIFAACNTVEEAGEAIRGMSLCMRGNPELP